MKQPKLLGIKDRVWRTHMTHVPLRGLWVRSQRVSLGYRLVHLPEASASSLGAMHSTCSPG